MRIGPTADHHPCHNLGAHRAAKPCLGSIPRTTHLPQEEIRDLYHTSNHAFRTPLFGSPEPISP